MSDKNNQNQQKLAPQLYKRFFCKKKYVIVAITALIIISAGIWLFLYLQKPQAVSQKTRTVDETIAEADKTAFQGNRQGATKLLDTALGKTTNANDKSKILAEKTVILYDGGDSLDDALQAALGSYNAKKTLGSASLVGMVARKKGDVATAKQYYTIALSLIDNSDPLAKSDQDYLNGILSDLDQSKL